MANLISERLHQYFEELEASLNLSEPHTRTIVDEVRADVVTRIAAQTSEGQTEEDAVKRILEELGTPRELANSIRSTVPPWGTPAFIYTRYLLSGLLVLLSLWVTWNIRSTEWGFSTLRIVAITSIFLPIFLLTWPGIVWRKNWMFSFISTVVAFAFVMLALAVGSESAQPAISLDLPPATAVEALHPGDPSYSTVQPVAYFVLAIFAALTVYLLTMLQRRQQLLLTATVPLFVLLAIELPFFIEEYRFEENVEAIDSQLELYLANHDELPSQDKYTELSKTWDVDQQILFHPVGDRRTYSLFLSRPLQSNSSICFDSENGWFWVND
ncbi:hypothetical protein NG895_09025 [Aeoliella sp. ICT_H6.2]|uniref:Uncharacterized protein n=1 Tax=Aeoliella straminimaris TaxID=2954799 RepID=A0A9X2JFI5_9BACT|nr:hypothetical protein [Aeoliella straminimaris]MCO6044050.1 hypothetical protein [Aeoliella straminimaris]